MGTLSCFKAKRLLLCFCWGWDPVETATTVMAGDLIVEGGGFCGQRTASLDRDLGRFDGIALRVRGDGQVPPYFCFCRFQSRMASPIRATSRSPGVCCLDWGC